MEKTSEEPQDQNDLEETSSSIEGKLLDSYLRTEFSPQNVHLYNKIMVSKLYIKNQFKK